MEEYVELCSEVEECRVQETGRETLSYVQFRLQVSARSGLWGRMDATIRLYRDEATPDAISVRGTVLGSNVI